MSEVKFEWKYDAKGVLLAGSFNRWTPLQMKKVNGKFEATVPLQPGVYTYKFVVDGSWCYDINKPTCDDNHGSRNNTITVGAGKIQKGGAPVAKNVPAQKPPAQKGSQSKPQQSKGAKKDIKQKANIDVNELKEPDYWNQRIQLWEDIKKRHAKKPSNRNGAPITITLPDGAQKEGIAGVTTPMDIAKGISNGLAQNVIVAKVDDLLWDSFRPLEKDCRVELIKFESDEGKKVFWHSSAHIMGQALELIFNCSLCVGPPLPNGGFYYDMATLTDKEGYSQSFEQEHADVVKKVVDRIIKDKQPFERLVLKKEEALEMFQYNKYKVELISEKVPDGGTCTAYRCGPLIDLCKGPHMPHTGKIKAFEVWKNASAYWKGNAENDSLQRVYGMTFPDPKQFAEWKKEMELAKQRDHRLQGTKQELFFFHELSPGCCFFLPRGARIYNRLVEFIRGEYRKRGFTEVISPNMYNKDLWITSGHWLHYKDDMFCFEVENQDFALKPMNCPGHCLMFLNKKRSYKELPLRFADFGVLHRNELAGALTGLTRVRRFCQDDAHIFCRPDQIASEIRGCFDFLKFVYDIFGWHFTLELSTRPEKKYIGDIETWNNAEKSLAQCLTDFVGESGWKLNPGDGAFYGPKIDIHVFDALKREHQCATIQLDFNLPKNFDLKFVQDDGTETRPVMIHRAVLGSLERFIAILVENTAGKWPFWLSPRPCVICTISPQHEEYAKEVYNQLFAAGFDADIDLSDHTVPKKVAVAQNQGYNYILVVGQLEMEHRTVNVRLHNEQHEKSVPELIREWHNLLEQHK